MRVKEMLKALNISFLVLDILFLVTMLIGYNIEFRGFIHVFGMIGCVLSSVALGVTGVIYSCL